VFNFLLPVTKIQRNCPLQHRLSSAWKARQADDRHALAHAMTQIGLEVSPYIIMSGALETRGCAGVC
jgi:hypothetical protein